MFVEYTVLSIHLQHQTLKALLMSFMRSRIYGFSCFYTARSGSNIFTTLTASILVAVLLPTFQLIILREFQCREMYY